jgi:hypothetical protein
METFAERRARRASEETARLLASPYAVRAYSDLMIAFSAFGKAVLPAIDASDNRAHALGFALKLMRDAESEAWDVISPKE